MRAFSLAAKMGCPRSLDLGGRTGYYSSNIFVMVHIEYFRLLSYINIGLGHLRTRQQHNF